MRAEELSRAAEDLFVEAQDALGRANSTACREVDDAKARAATEGEELLERARKEARELARLTAEEEQVRREQLAVLEEHRTRVMEELGVLHQRLGDIGDGLSAPTPAPAPVPRQAQQGQQAKQQRPRQGQAALESPARASGAAGRDDDPAALELPAGGTGAKATRRRVASSTR